MNLNNRVKNRFEISEILKSLLLKVSKLEKNTGSTQVNSDWNATSGPALILNKPPIDNTRLLKAAIKVDNSGSLITSLNIFRNTLNNTNPLVVSQLGVGEYAITSMGSFTGTLYRQVNVSASGNTRLDIIKISDHMLLLVNRSLTNPSTGVNIGANTSEFFEFELY